MLEAYALALLYEHKQLRCVVGIGTEPAGSGGASEDLVFVEDINWTEDLVKFVEEQKALFDIMQPHRMKKRHVDEAEYPAVPEEFLPAAKRASSTLGMNRKQRRALKAQERKR